MKAARLIFKFHITKFSNFAGNLEFEDEIDAIRREVNRLLASGLNKIIVIGTADYTINLRIANEVHGVDIVAGADPFTLRTRGKPVFIPSLVFFISFVSHQPYI